MKKQIKDINSYEELVTKLKQKRITENKVKRMLLHILCNYTKDTNKKMTEVKYIRILGFNEKGRKYLSSIKKDITVPLISKIKREKEPMLELELKCQAIYNLLSNEAMEEKVFPIVWEDKNDKK